MAVALIVFVAVWLLIGVLVMTDNNDSHWIPWDAPKIVRLQRRAVCGALTDNHSSEPTCRECREYLARVAEETIESRYGTAGKK